MYCKNCGAELDDGAKFCKNCGTPIAGDDDTDRRKNPLKDDDKAKRKLSASFYVALINAPILFIIRMLTYETETRIGWRKYTTTYVPSYAKAIMFVLMVGIVVTSMFLKKESGVKKMSLKILITNILSVLIGLLIIFAES